MTDIDPMECSRCGQPHGGCRGHNRAGNPCGKPPKKGQRVCGNHGGDSPQALAAADRRIKIRELEANINAILVKDGVTRIDDPFELMAQVAAEARDFKDALANRLAAIESIRYKASESGTEQLRAEVLLYERALDRTAKFLDILMKSSFEERRVRISEDTGRLIAAAFQQFIGAPGMAFTDEQLAQVPVVLPPILRAIGSGDAA